MAKSSKNRKSRSRQRARKSPATTGRKSASRAAAGPKSTARARQKKGTAAMVFSPRNYHLMLLGVVLVIIGYTIMRLENEVDGIISLYVAPLIILGGYLEIIYAILWRPKAKPAEPDQTAAQNA